MKKKIKKALKKYKPIDRKLRNNKVYKNLSLYLYKLYNEYVASENEIKKYYFQNYSSSPIDPNIYFFDCFWGRKVGCNPYALYRELVRRNTNGIFVWVRNEGVSIPNDVNNNPNVIFVKHASKEYAEYLLRAKYLFANSNFSTYFTKKEGQIFVNTWHGIPLKKLGLDIEKSPLSASANTQRNFNIADIIPMSGKYADIKTVEAYGSSRNNVRYFGSPRIDMMLSANKETMKKYLNIHDDKPIILYAPTWRGVLGEVNADFSIQEDAISVIKKAYPHAHVFVSLHHLTKKYFEESNINFNEVPSHIDITEFLSCVDILVSDYSSIFIDYLCLNKPIVLYVPDFTQYKEERGLYFDLNELPVNYASNTTELITICNDLKKPSEFCSYAGIKNSLLSFEFGTASEAVIDEIFRLPKENNVDFKSKKINLAIYPGGLKNNGITKSFLSLVKNINHDKYCVHVIIDCSHKFSKPKQDNINLIDDNCNVLLVSGGSLMSNEERKDLHNYISGSVDITPTLDSAFKREARRITNDIYFDSVIDFSGYSPKWALLLSYFNSNNKIIYLHSDMMAEANNRKKNHNLYPVFNLYSKYHSLVSVSKQLLEVNLIKLKEFSSGEKFKFVSNALDFDKVIKKSKEPLSDDLLSAYSNLQVPNVIRFISIGRLSPEKNIDLLIISFSKALKLSNQPMILTIVGEGPERESLLKLATKLGIKEFIIFAGHQDNPYNLLQLSDCLVFPSEYEGQGLVLLEAMALNKYCIASDIPVLSSILSEKYGVNCTLSIDSFTCEILSFIKNKPRAEEFDYNNYLTNAMNEFYTVVKKN